MSDKHAG